MEITGNPVGEFASCEGLNLEVETTEYAEGGNNSFVHIFPTRQRFSPLTLSRGITEQAVLLDWLLAVHDRKEAPTDMTISLMAQSSVPAATWSAASAYPTRWTGPQLNAASTQVATESLTIVHQGLKVV